MPRFKGIPVEGGPRFGGVAVDSAGAPVQFASGFNQGIAKYTDAPERLIVMASDLARLKKPNWQDAGNRAEITKWLRNGVADPQTALQRVARRAGQEVGTNVPYAALGIGGAPTAAAAAPGMAGNLAQRSAGALAQSIARAPGSAAIGETAAVVGAGTGAGVAREFFPGNQNAETYGQIAGGFAPAAAAYGPTSLAMRLGNIARSRLSSEAQTRHARETVSRVIGPGAQAGREGLIDGERLRSEIPGYRPSLAESTGSPSLIATQRAIESRLSGAPLETASARREGNLNAVEAYRKQNTPDGVPDVVIDTTTSRMNAIKGRVSSAIDSVTGRQRDVADKLQPVDLDATGGELRANLLERQDVARVRMAKLADDLGVSEVDLTIPFRKFQDEIKTEISQVGAFADKSNVPSVARDIINYGKRSDDSMRSFLREMRYGTGEKPVSLVQFIRSKGGLKDDAGELRARDASKKFPGFVRANGRSMDDVALLATEAGYIAPGKDRGTVDELLKAIDTELAGSPVYSLNDDALVARSRDLDTFRDELSQAGIDMNLPDDEIVRRMDFSTGAGGSTVTFKDLMGLRSRITDDIRDAISGATPSVKKVRTLETLKAKVDGFVNSATESANPELAKNWKAFRDAYKTEYIDRFNQGAAFKVRAKDGRGYYQTPNERVAEQFVKDVSGAKQFKRTFGEDAPQTEALESVLLDDLRASAVRDGKVNQQLLESWVSRKGAVLGEFPGALKQITNINQLNKALKARAASLAERERVIGGTLLSREIEAVSRGSKQPEAFIQDAIKNPVLMRQITGRVRGNATAMAGLKRAVWDNVSKETPDSIKAHLENPGVRQVLGAEHVNALNNILRASKQISRVPAPAGQPYDPNSLAEIEAQLGTGINQISSRVFAVSSGRTSPRYVAMDLMGRFWRGHSKQETSRILEEALYDPAVARDLANLITAPPMRQAAAKRLNTWLFNVGATEEE